jgi:perosamine synthetase
MKSSIELFDCRMQEDGVSAARDVLLSGQISSGSKIHELESALSERLGVDTVVAVSDATHALALSLILAGVRPGDDVMTVAFTCLSSSSAIAQVGAKPIWVDINPETASVSLSDCAQALSSKPRAMVVYHIAGYPAPMSELRTFCCTHGLTLIEDANNALGARYNGRPIGQLGDFAAFSFYANRQINAIDGGAVAIRDSSLRSRAERLRRYGIDQATFRDKEGEISASSGIPEIGMSAAFNNVHAAIALSQLASLDDRLTKSRANATRYNEAFRKNDGVIPVLVPDGSEPAYWAYLVRVKDRKKLQMHLRDAGIKSSGLHFPNNTYSGFEALPRALPGTDQFSTEVLALPTGWWMESADVDRVIDVVLSACDSKH